MRIVYGVLLIAILVVGAKAQFPAGFGWVFPRESPTATVTQLVGVTDITIKYSRPSAKGRQLWGCQTTDVVPKPGAPYGCLVPSGQVWRAGANEATTITFSTPVSIEGQPLQAGTYGLFMIPGESEWTIIFSKKPKQWGSFTYSQADDALRVTVKPQQSSEHQEQLIYDFPLTASDKAEIALRWEKMKVVVKVSVDTAKESSAKARTSFDPASGYFAAEYYYLNKTNLEEGLKWINAALAFNEAGSFLMLKAKILAELKRYPEAIETAEKALKGFRERNQVKPGQDVEALINQWKTMK